MSHLTWVLFLPSTQHNNSAEFCRDNTCCLHWGSRNTNIVSLIHSDSIQIIEKSFSRLFMLIQNEKQNTEMLKRANILSIEATLFQKHLRCIEHVIRMLDHRMPKEVLHSHLVHGSRNLGDLVKTTLKNMSSL